MTTAHTATPWIAHKEGNRFHITGTDDARPAFAAAVATVDNDDDRQGDGTCAATAEFIIRACNAHDDLVRSVSDLLSDLRAACDEIGMSERLFDGLDLVKAGKAALAKATGAA